jgi:hypothetical protein
MGMTLWIHTVEDRTCSKDSDDHSLMHDFSEKLDVLCENAKLRKLSDFLDFTDLEYNYSSAGSADDEDDEDDEDDKDDEDDEEPKLDPETGFGYGIDDMDWFNASDGLATLTALRNHVNAGALEELTEDERDGLLEELADCISILEGPASRGGKFHLAVVE